VDETEKGKAASENAPKRRSVAWWVEILIAIAVVIIVVGIAIPAFNISKTYARRGEAKANLHEIQMGIERFAYDTGGTYPDYLIGGSAPLGDDPKHPFAQASDPLLRGGYISAYPRNPFSVPQTVKAMQEQYKDPLCPGTSESKYGYRFGEDYTLMGQVLADFRYPKASYTEGKNVVTHQSYADFGYPFWDIWPKNSKPKPFLPGEFFYKSVGNIVVANKESVNPDRPIVPTIVEIYMLGLYGSVKDTGKDILGVEPTLAFRPNTGQSGAIEEFTVPVWTRSTDKPDEEGQYLGSPYRQYSGNALQQIDYGSPNGIPDAIILVLVPGEDTKGARE
jgi:type II secretory pathway pseudopilin PulG